MANVENITLGSLFDGSGGWPLAGQLNGVTPLWASEVEPFPIRVTTRRFPRMTHYGDVSRLNGAELPPVTILTGGSPCQDISLAGRKTGLDGDRSNLFYQQIRVIREMRDATHGQAPRFALWENVAHVLPINHGLDFHRVLEEFVHVANPNLDVPQPADGRWADAGLIMGDGFSVAWRLMDAQYWGVPQRRRRIFLAADFGGHAAGQVLFDPRNEPGDPAARGEDGRDDTPGACASLAGERGRGDTEETVAAYFQHYPQAARLKGPMSVADTVTRQYGSGGGNTPIVANIRLHPHADKAQVRAHFDTNPMQPAHTLDVASRGGPDIRQGATIIFQSPWVGSRDHWTRWDTKTTVPTLCRRDYKAPQAVAAPWDEYRPRRLTPLECCRLQGFPDDWCDGLDTPDPTAGDMVFWRQVFDTQARLSGVKPRSDTMIRQWLRHPYSDAAAYRMWGNGMALPCAQTIIRGCVRALQGDDPGTPGVTITGTLF